MRPAPLPRLVVRRAVTMRTAVLVGALFFVLLGLWSGAHEAGPRTAGHVATQSAAPAAEEWGAATPEHDDTGGGAAEGLLGLSCAAGVLAVAAWLLLPAAHGLRLPRRSRPAPRGSPGQSRAVTPSLTSLGVLRI